MDVYNVHCTMYSVHGYIGYMPCTRDIAEFMAVVEILTTSTYK